MESKVLVFKSELLKSLGLFQGYTRNIDNYLPIILNPKNNYFIDRDLAERDPSYKQIIPYVVLKFQNSIFSYVRGKQSEEKRLIGKQSIGLGGHIEQVDQELTSTDTDLYEKSIEREINEEVVIDTKHIEQTIALINDDTTEVGKVHFGILHIWELEKPNVNKKEETITNAQFIEISKLKNMKLHLESWSKLALDIICSSH